MSKRKHIKAYFLKNKGMTSLLLGLVWSSQSFAQIVQDYGMYGKMLAAATQMTSLIQVTGQVNSRICAVKDAIGTVRSAMNNPLITGLKVFGRCENPFQDLKNSFLSFGQIRPNFDFCSLLEGRNAYTNMLFNPLTQEGKPIAMTPAKQKEISLNRQRVLQKSTVNNLAVAAQQKQGLNEARQNLQAVEQRAREARTFIEQQAVTNQLLIMIHKEQIQVRALQIEQTELLASDIAKNFPLTYNPLSE